MTSGTHNSRKQAAARLPGRSDSDGPRVVVSRLEVGLGRTGPDVVSDVSFSVSAGEVLGLVGESGSGKTTVALALMAHARRGLAIRSGAVLLDGVDLLGLSATGLRSVRGAKVAYVPQDPSAALNPALRIGAQLNEALSVHPGVVEDPAARVAEVIAEVRLGEIHGILRRYPHQLSGGQQQRVALAMAFACRPSLIILDEPTTGLDVSTQRHVLETIRALCRTYGVAAVYVSHDLAVVGDLVTTVAVMYAGRVVEVGATEQVFGNPVHPYTRGLLAAAPAPDRAELLVGIDGQPPRPGERPAGCAFAQRCGFATDVCITRTPPQTPFRDRVVRCLRVAEIDTAHRQTAARLGRVEGEMESILTVAGLSARYGEVPVLADVDLEAARQRCLAIVGESGSGKTTLARCLVGMHANWTGEISYRGEPLAATALKRPRGVLREIQYIFQNPYTSLNPRKTVGQILSQPLEHFSNFSSAQRSSRVAGVLDDVSLGSSYASRYPDQLSGGERQRVAIARALIVEPDLLVCDEVTSALDVSVQATIVELLRALQHERRLSLLFITHNLALVRSIAQSVLVLRDGRVVESGTTDDILEHPTDPYTIRLMQDVPKLGSAGANRSDPQPSATGRQA